MFFFLVVWITLVISIFIDNFRRDDHSGWAKAGWTFLIIALPFLGVLIYMIARPQMTDQDMQILAQADKQQSGFSTGEELERLHKLKEQGAISAEEYDKMKAGLVG
jgi:hypothetical protein